MQSSSGGEEEYDSSAPPFFNNPPPTHFGSISSNPRPSFFYQHQPNLFDLSPNYLHALSQTQPNHSSPNSADLASLNKLSTSSSAAPPEPNHGSMLHNGARAATQRNSKKRTRATRRAPTTVLTTDTTNFRAMVQEFTGIPSPPFSGSSPYSRRLDLFGSGSSFRSSGHLEAVGGGSSSALYPLRPSPQKVLQPPSPFLMSSSSSSSSSLLNNAMVDATNVGNSTTLNNYHQLPSNLGLPRQPQNMLNMQNPILTFQSSSSSSLPQQSIPGGFGAPSPGSLALPSLEELGMSHGHANLNLGGGGLPINHGAGSNGGRPSQEHLRPLDGSYGNSPRVGGCKLNYSASSSSDFNVHDKSLENVSGSRGDGTVDSWLCHSG